MSQRFFIKRPAFFLSICLAAILGAGAPRAAHALTFTFSFTNSANGGGTVTGTIYGLSDNTSNESSTEIDITSNTLGFGLGTYGTAAAPGYFDNGAPGFDSFSVSGGVITSAQLEYFGEFNSSPNVTCCSLYLYYNTAYSNGYGLTDSSSSVNDTQDDSDIFANVATTPIPSALPLFLSGLGAMGWFSCRRRRKSAAAAV
jgi:hypothetical protein